ncbi:MAG: hypothetical protein U5K51_09195 [Flavobacteriaceae bacterium]|nr:hypothetical protein [Flavobacteriaceae bacterium]
MKSFPKDQFFEIWDDYLRSFLHDTGARIFASILEIQTDLIWSKTKSRSCSNKLMKAELEKVRPKALQHLREKLNNYSLDFEIAINEEETGKIAYTNQEKYEYLREKNEAIAYLRKVFKLDL